MLRKTLITISFVGAVLFVYGLGFFTRQIVDTDVETPSTVLDFSLFWEAYGVLEKNFVDAQKIDYRKLIHGAISGMVDSLDDPHTVFFTPDDTGKFLEDADGKFEGVGMEVGLKDKFITVIAPIKGTPAEKAGMMSGDLILKIDGQETFGMSVEQAVTLIRGPKNTKVVLTIYRQDWQEEKDITITRDLIKLPSLEWEMVDGFAHIKFYHFYMSAGNDFKKISREIIDSPAQGIILDLRNNPGGYLEAANDISDWFFDQEYLFLIEDYGYRKIERKSDGLGHLSQYPTVVIINKGSASASEILAGVLRDNKKVPLIGEQSFGKGSIQKLEYLSDRSSIKITVANWLTPNGTKISGEGLAPDYQAEEEFQLTKAIEVLKEKM
jgi:carboxyl-terminal processing protease